MPQTLWRMNSASMRTGRSLANVATAAILSSIICAGGTAADFDSSVRSQLRVAENTGVPVPPTGNGTKKPTKLRPCQKVCVESANGATNPPTPNSYCIKWKTVC